MNLRFEIERIFGDTAFARPLFYAYPGGLRFELSETGGVIEQFLTALRKSTTICSDIFIDAPTLVACLRLHSGTNRFAHRPVIRARRSAGITLPAQCTVWSEEIDPQDRCCESEPEYWINLAFEAPMPLLQAFLWCALARDFGAIQPSPDCTLRLFNLNRQVMVFPYDDRGMDVVGPNKALLSQLYRKHHAYLLEYDRQAMDATFTEPACPFSYVWLLPLLEKPFATAALDLPEAVSALSEKYTLPTGIALQPLVITALTSDSDYWTGLALKWLEDGFPVGMIALASAGSGVANALPAMELRAKTMSI